ncbi:MAG: serine/threonine protein kinase [Verrucomicrobiales bacterium]|nr:serine/threonine protein kinase [Verrucomicrobiales bacterium]
MTAPTPNQLCPDCGTPVPPAAPEGLCPRCLARAAVDSADQPGPGTDSLAEEFAARRFFGDYELLGEVARGGMGIVFKARQLGVNRVVALKALAGGAAAGREFVHRFHNEAASAARLEHPHIVPIYEFGEHEGTHFLAMRFLAGGTLQSRVAKEVPAPAEAARTIITLANAVEHAHRRGVLHRDLKPGNVLLDGDGAPHVADFGLARVMEDEDTLTLSRAVIGTAAYLAPEVAGGGAACATVASDIYGLGAILYELLTGRPPFGGTTVGQTLRAVQDDKPIRPGQIRSAVPSDLETICLKCLEKDPARRYATAQGLADDLERFLNGEPVHARPVTGAERAWRWCRRKPALALALATVLLLLSILVIGLPV